MREQPSYYSILTADVRYSNKIGMSEKVLFSEITALANKNGYCSATNGYFSDLYGKNKTTVSKWISKLKEQGFVKIVLIREGKQIIRRKLYPVTDPKLRKDVLGGIGKNTNTPMKKEQEGIGKNTKGGIGKNAKENITSNNNININKERGIKDNPKIKFDWSTIVDKLLDYYAEQAHRFRMVIPKVTNHERMILIQTVRGKPLADLYKAVDDTIFREPDYPMGYLIKCISNIEPIKERS